MMQDKKELYRSLCIEAIREAGYRKDLSPWMQEVVLETADEIYCDKVAEARNGRRSLPRIARKWFPSQAV